MKKFEVGYKYEMKSPCDQNCIWSYEVAARTAKTVTLINKDGQQQKCRIQVYENQERCKPLGSYSMAPTLRA